MSCAVFFFFGHICISCKWVYWEFIKLDLMGIAFKDYKNVGWRLEMYALLFKCKKNYF